MKKVTVLYTTVNNAASFRPYNDKVQTIVDEKLDELWKVVTVIDDYNPSTEGASDDLDICEKYYCLHNQISTDTLKTAIVNCGSEVKWYQDTRDESDIGHTSMSVGDIIKIEDETGTRLFYCDDVGFLQIDYILDPTSRTYQDAKKEEQAQESACSDDDKSGYCIYDNHEVVTLSHDQVDNKVTQFYSEEHNAEYIIFDRSLKDVLPDDVEFGEWYHLFQVVKHDSLRKADGSEAVQYILAGKADHNDPVLFKDDHACDCEDCEEEAEEVDYNELARELIDLCDKKMPSDEQIQDFAGSCDQTVDQIDLKDACIARENDIEYNYALSRAYNTLNNIDFGKYNHDLNEFIEMYQGWEEDDSLAQDPNFATDLENYITNNHSNYFKNQMHKLNRPSDQRNVVAEGEMTHEDRIDGLVNQKALADFISLAGSICEDLEKEGFDNHDVRIFLNKAVSDTLYGD